MMKNTNLLASTLLNLSSLLIGLIFLILLPMGAQCQRTTAPNLDDLQAIFPGDSLIDSSVLRPFKAVYEAGRSDSVTITLKEAIIDDHVAMTSTTLLHLKRGDFIDQTSYTKAGLYPLRAKNAVKNGEANQIGTYNGANIDKQVLSLSGNVEETSICEITESFFRVLPAETLPLREGFAIKFPIERGCKITWTYTRVIGRESVQIAGENFDTWLVDNGPFGKLWIVRHPPYLIKRVFRNGSTWVLRSFETHDF